MGASLGFFGLVRPLLSDCSAAHWQSVTVTDSESLGMTWLEYEIELQVGLTVADSRGGRSHSDCHSDSHGAVTATVTARPPGPGRLSWRSHRGNLKLEFEI